jgi:hypothetical protein
LEEQQALGQISTTTITGEKRVSETMIKYVWSIAYSAITCRYEIRKAKKKLEESHAEL